MMKKQTKIAFGVLILSASFLFYSFIVNRAMFLSVVKTDAGLVSGVENSSGDVTAYKGIPFAAPPVGNLRWKAPQPVARWDGVKKCDAFGPSPMQSKPVPFMVYTSEFLIPEQPISEDCLYLNVWTNAKTKADKKPVFVWIYGGGFGSGGSACAIYDGEAMAKKGVVFVSINYRVGAFGFLAHPELTKESKGKASGNYGLLDQIAALKWIQKNIAAFGGDAHKVTIAGQSAGSMSVNCLVASPLAKGLFSSAIAESGSLLIKNPLLAWASLQTAQEQGVKLAEKAGARSLAQMRALSAEQVQKKFERSYGPIIDGYVLPEPVADIFAANKQNHVPVIIGWNGDEFGGGTQSKEDFRKKAQKDYGSDAETFLKYFPAQTDEQAKRSQIELNRDRIFALSGYQWANVQSEIPNSPVYVYNFARKVPAMGDMVKYGAFHTAEVPYMMDNLKFLNNRPFAPADRELAKQMSAYWVNFVKTGNPNGDGLPLWPKYNTGGNMVMVFDEKSSAEKLPGKDGLDFLLSKTAK
ncbi:MAG: carboxylesterase family protein [Mucilaginibacter sp.]|nr:carboxylesterase family protein [Mucilaginibacter sp.]